MVLRTVGSSLGVEGGWLETAAEDGHPREVLTLDVDELSIGDLKKLSAEKNTKAIAADVPVQLITPFAVRSFGEESSMPSNGGGNNGETGPLSPVVPWGIRAVGADVSPRSGRGATVAVLDTGIDLQHSAFHIQAGGCEHHDFTGEGIRDVNGHGTHCAGTIAGQNTDGYRIGVAPGVSKMLIAKVLRNGGGRSEWVMQAMHWANKQGADVISMSLGIDFGALVKRWAAEMPVEQATSQALEEFRQNVKMYEAMTGYLTGQGKFGHSSLVVAAAGNASRRQANPAYSVYATVPAVSEGILSVGALGEGVAGWEVAHFSNTGPMLCGPGVDILSAKSGGGLQYMSGTSMATPHVVGVAALWVEQLKTEGAYSVDRLRARLMGRANYQGAGPGHSADDCGLGMVHAPQAEDGASGWPA